MLSAAGLPRDFQWIGSPVLTAAQVRAFEAESFAAGADPFEWMQAAGEAAAARIWALLDQRSRRGRVVVLCGPGNNGGDGYCVARDLLRRGVDVRVYGMSSHAKETSAGRRAAALLKSVAVIYPFADLFVQGERGEMEARLPSALVFVDAMFGVGWRALAADVMSGDAGTPHQAEARNVQIDAVTADARRLTRYRLRDAQVAAVVSALNARNQTSRVFALDLPTGLDADTGRLAGLRDALGEDVAVRADETVTFVALKRGLLTGRAAAFVGRVTLADLGQTSGVKRFCWHRREQREGVDGAAAFEIRVEAVPCARAPCALARTADAHKGDAGWAHVVLGSAGMAGAAFLAARAAARGGAGRVVLWTSCGSGSEATGSSAKSASGSLVPRSLQIGDLRLSMQPETMLREFSEAPAPNQGAVVLGPGLGVLAPSTLGLDGDRISASTVLAWRDKHRDSGALSWIIDADALRALSALPIAERNRWTSGAVLTPHPGEAAALLGCDVGAIEHDRYAAALQLACAHDATVVLKGAGSLVASPDGRCTVVTGGHAGMATAGMGDVLAGILAAVLAERNAAAATRSSRGSSAVESVSAGASCDLGRSRQCESLSMRLSGPATPLALDRHTAAVIAVAWHLRAAERAAWKLGGQIGLLASDVIEALPATRYHGDG
ncbi:MAG: bifunctional ADP-dependent NAD(P)H-hydrate dehydratase/NAD(P)H-hydrate epimerase [Thioalkalivibrionaceae bacterium]